MTSTSHRLAVALLLVLTASVPLGAQGVQTGTIRGIVVDAQGLAVPGVTVTVTSAALQGQRTVVTEMDGTYVVRQLPAGNYRLQFELSAFTTVRRELPYRSAAPYSRTSPSGRLA